MAKISTYPLEGNPKLSDKLIGTSVGLNQIGNLENPTYNFSLQQLLNLFSPLLPGNTLQGVLDNNNSATQDINLNGTIYTGGIEVSGISNIFSAYITDSLYIEAGLFDRNNSQGTSGQILTSTGSGVEWVMPIDTVPTLQEVLMAGNQASLNIILTADLTAEGINADDILVQNSFQLNGTLIDSNGLTGASGQMLISLGTGVLWENVPVYTASSPLFINPATKNITIQQANGTQNGYLSFADWITFDGKQNALSGTGIVVSNEGIISYVTDNSFNWNRAYNDSIISAAVTGITIKTLTLTQRDGDIITASWSDEGGGISSIGLSMPSAFTVTNSPLTSDGVIEVQAAGTALEYIKGDGTLGTLPSVSGFVPYTGATADVDLGINDITANSIIKNGGTSSQFLKADGSVDSGSYITLLSLFATSPLSYDNTTGTFSIQQANSSQDGYLSSADWNVFDGKQDAGNYITDLIGEASASGPGNANVILNNAAVISKVLTGLNITGGTVVSTDTILQAFGKLQNQVSGLIGGTTYQGVWNASTNVPTLVSSVGTDGYYYIVNVSGNTNLNGITDWNIGDWAIFHGGTWQKVDNTDAVVSVNGYTGAVNLVSSDIPEGLTNLYFTDARARLAFSFTAGSGAYNNTTGQITIPTDNSQILNGAGYITNSALAPYLLISTAASTYYPIPTGTTSQYVRGDGSLATFPGLTGFVPYVGATQDLNLGTHKLLAADLVINHTSGSGVAASITKNGNGEALTVVKGSGSGNAASITGGVTLISELHLTTDLADTYIASAAIWNAKQNAISLTTVGTSGPATFNGVGLNIPQYQDTTYIFSAPLQLQPGNNVVINLAGTSQDGYLSSTDWNTFNNKAGVSFLGPGQIPMGSLTGDLFPSGASINGASFEYLQSGSVLPTGALNLLARDNNFIIGVHNGNSSSLVIKNWDGSFGNYEAIEFASVGTAISYSAVTLEWSIANNGIRYNPVFATFNVFGFQIDAPINSVTYNGRQLFQDYTTPGTSGNVVPMKGILGLVNSGIEILSFPSGKVMGFYNESTTLPTNIPTFSSSSESFEINAYNSNGNVLTLNNYDPSAATSVKVFNNTLASYYMIQGLYEYAGNNVSYSGLTAQFKVSYFAGDAFVVDWNSQTGSLFDKQIPVLNNYYLYGGDIPYVTVNGQLNASGLSISEAAGGVLNYYGGVSFMPNGIPTFSSDFTGFYINNSIPGSSYQLRLNNYAYPSFGIIGGGGTMIDNDAIMGLWTLMNGGIVYYNQGPSQTMTFNVNGGNMQFNGSALTINGNPVGGLPYLSMIPTLNPIFEFNSGTASIYEFQIGYGIGALFNSAQGIFTVSTPNINYPSWGNQYINSIDLQSYGAFFQNPDGVLQVTSTAFFGNYIDTFFIGPYNARIQNQFGNLVVSDTNTYNPSLAVSTYNANILNENGQLYILNSTTYSQVFIVDGTNGVYAYAYNTLSDASLKQNVVAIQSALDKVVRLNGVSFDWKEGSRADYGFIAQQVKEVIPEVVKQNKETGIHSVNYTSIIAIQNEAIKELKKEIDQLKNLII